MAHQNSGEDLILPPQSTYGGLVRESSDIEQPGCCQADDMIRRLDGFRLTDRFLDESCGDGIAENAKVGCFNVSSDDVVVV